VAKLIGRSSTTRLRLLCHASTSAVRTSAFPADEPIDSQKRHVLAVTRRRVLHADRCLTSPALRTRQTAEALQLDATIEPTLRDCDYGRWAGLSFDKLQAEQPAALADWMCDPATAPDGGESILSLIERVGAWLEAQSWTPGKTVAITHASVIRAAVVHAIGAPPQSFWRIDIAPLSITSLSGTKGRWNLVSTNCTPSNTTREASEITSPSEMNTFDLFQF
jgi:broad specificity phosphatase PhoE